MNWNEFQNSLPEAILPPGLSPALGALWHDKQGDWAGAHTMIQDASDADSAWVHAYLHRKEGDERNAGYWYRRAGQPVFTGSLDDEWRAIAQALLSET